MDIFVSKYLRYLIVLVLSSALLFILVYAAFSDRNILVAYCDSSFIVGFTLLGIGSFQIIGNQGTFDLVNYGFANMFSVLRKPYEKRYEDLASYRELKSVRRKADRFIFIPYYIFAAIYLIIAIILLLIIRKTLY
jgi:hypothetical protein